MKRARICILLAITLIFVFGFGSIALANGPDLAADGFGSPHGKICIEKTINSLDGDPQEGVMFELYRLRHFGWEKVEAKDTESDGKVCFNGLVYDDYKVVEVVPDGYTSSWKGNEKQVKIDKWHKTINLEVVNTENPGHICIEKRESSVEGEPMQGILFTLTCGETQIEGYTDVYGIVCFDQLEPGTYTLVEENVPNGYTTSLTAENNQITVGPGEEKSIVVINTKIPDPHDPPEPRDERKVRWPDRTPPPEELEAAADAVPLPRTGGLIEWEWVALAGGMLTSGGGALYLIRRRRIKK